MRILVGGVGYRNLRDDSLGPYVSDVLAGRAGDGVEVEDLSYGPVHIAQTLQARLPYDRLVLVAAVRRGRPAGTVERYRWDGALPPVDEIQARVAEALMGVISLDNLLVVCGALTGLPADVRVVEVEPAGDERFGESFSPLLEERLPGIVDLVWASARH